MTDLQSALATGDLTILLWTAAALGFLHTILGPDHYVPFVMMAKAQRWSRTKTLMITTLCALGHVGSSVAIGAGLAYAGMQYAAWEGSDWATWHESRGSLTAWFLIGIGVAFFIWGLVQALRGRPHTHAHIHTSGEVHKHSHEHTKDHLHPHQTPVRKITPWILFTIFLFGPCESLIPLMLASWAVAGGGGAALVAGAFSLITVCTILATVGVLLLGISRIHFAKLDRWSTSLAGASLVACGAAIQWLGL